MAGLVITVERKMHIYSLFVLYLYRHNLLYSGVRIRGTGDQESDMTEASKSAKTQPKTWTLPVHGAVPREDFMPVCERMLEIYMRRLGLDGQPMTLSAAELARAGRTRPPALTADSCGARLRDGSLCTRPPVEGRRRCRSHGCAPRTGAPKGNRNALKHGRFTTAEVARGRRISEFVRECRETIRQLEGR